LLEAVVPFNLLTDQARRGRQREGAGSLAQASAMLDQARRPPEEGQELHRPKVIFDGSFFFFSSDPVGPSSKATGGGKKLCCSKVALVRSSFFPSFGRMLV
jgi:hypothetical protein